MSYCLVIKTPWNILFHNTGQSTNWEQHVYVPLTVLLHTVWSRNSLKSLTKITFTCNDGITVWAVKLCHILCVFLQDVHLHGAALCETSMADVALVWLLTCNRRRRVSYSPKKTGAKTHFDWKSKDFTRVCPHVSLQLISVSAGIAAKTALEGSLPCVRADVPFQLAHLGKETH